MADANLNSIRIRGAREHNLRNVDLELPRDKLIVFTGLSGSGKSSLAFDTIYAEGQRRYVESLSAYARQFLGPDGQARRRLHRGPVAGDLDRPEVGVAQPALDGRHDHRDLRLPAAALRPHRRAALPRTAGGVITRQTPQQIVDRVLQLPEGTRFQVLAPVVRGRKGEYDDAARRARRRRASPGRGSTASSSTSPAKLRRWPATSSTRSRSSSTGWCGAPGIERRLTDSLETALQLAEGVAEVEIVPREDDEAEPRDAHVLASTSPARTAALSFDELAPRNFSFNSPYGACEHCDGLGTRFEVDPELVVPDDDLSIDEGAIAPWSGFRSEYFKRVLDAVGRRVRLLDRRRRGRS